MTEAINALSATALLQEYSRGELSPVEATRAALGRIEELDADIHAFCLVDPETTLRSAAESEERYRRGQPRGLLDGVPVAIKDLFLTPMWPTTRGSKTVDPNLHLGKAAPAVAALDRHGYVPLGKTTTTPPAIPGTTSAQPAVPAAARRQRWRRTWRRWRWVRMPAAPFASRRRFAAWSASSPPSVKSLTGRPVRLALWLMRAPWHARWRIVRC